MAPAGEGMSRSAGLPLAGPAAPTAAGAAADDSGSRCSSSCCGGCRRPSPLGARSGVLAAALLSLPGASSGNSRSPDAAAGAGAAAAALAALGLIPPSSDLCALPLDAARSVSKLPWSERPEGDVSAPEAVLRWPPIMASTPRGRMKLPPWSLPADVPNSGKLPAWAAKALCPVAAVAGDTSLGS